MLDGEIRRLVESRVEIAIQIIEQKEHVRDEGREADILSGCETQLQRDVQRRLIEESIRRADE